MKPKHQRLAFIALSMMFLCLATLLTMRAFSDNLVFFYSPSDIAQKRPDPAKRLRVGGLVMEASVRREAGDMLHFRITDGANELRISYQGIPPNLFREGQGVIAEGYLDGPDMLRAQRILTKHDENYMPREVVDALKKTGRWKEGEEK